MQNLDVMKSLPSSYNPAKAAKLLNQRETPRDRLREKRIEEIVEVAVELFAKEGASGFSMRRVASLAGVTLSTLQHYFGKGENLLQITINSITARYIDRLRAIEHDRSLPARERFHVITDEIIGWSTDPVVSACYFELYALASKDKEVARLIEEVYVAYSRLCTHASCPLFYRSTENRLDCPCHGGAFSIADGSVLLGPPPRPLPRILLEERGPDIVAAGIVRQ